MKLYFLFTKKALVVITALFCLGVFVWGRFTAAKNVYKNGDTNAKRVYYLSTLGYEGVESEIGQKSLIITKNVAKKYSIEGFIGCKATVYNYYIKETEIDLIVYNGRIIGGEATPRNMT